jgi:hypothetical protein
VFSGKHTPAQLAGQLGLRLGIGAEQWAYRAFERQLPCCCDIGLLHVQHASQPGDAEIQWQDRDQRDQQLDEGLSFEMLHGSPCIGLSSQPLRRSGRNQPDLPVGIEKACVLDAGRRINRPLEIDLCG